MCRHGEGVADLQSHSSRARAGSGPAASPLSALQQHAWLVTQYASQGECIHWLHQLEASSRVFSANRKSHKRL